VTRDIVVVLIRIGLSLNTHLLKDIPHRHTIVLQYGV
jgi:hypothetical protein